MDKEKIVMNAVNFTKDSQLNYISDENALNPDYIGMKIFEAPIFNFGAADDDIYEKYKTPGIIGDHFLTPKEWLPSAKTVISFFLPYTKIIKSANAANFNWPAEEWLHGRSEGQVFINELTIYINNLLNEAGYESLIPVNDERFSGSPTVKFTSNWSERHAAFACGLGTFGLSGGVITEKGMCGRFSSIITALELPKDTRSYTEVYEYCNMCGLCVKHCPAGAISIEGGKDSSICSAFLDKVREKHNPRYGCGKCQVKVPCESGIPKQNL